MDSDFSAAKIEEFWRLINKLDAEKAALHNLPDKEFADAYLGFRDGVRNSVMQILPNSVLGINLFSITGSLGMAASAVSQKAMNSLLTDGIVVEVRDPNVFSLDPQPFRDMVLCIIQKSVPAVQHSFYRTEKFSDYQKFVVFGSNIMRVICEAGQGPSRAMVQLNFFKAVGKMINNIRLSSEDVEVRERVSTHSVEVEKNTGCVVIATYDTSFEGTVSRNCWFSSQTVEMSVITKVFKFSSIGDLHREFDRWQQ